jgi:DNA repair exonuclease SbcCD ATPase subunit
MRLLEVEVRNWRGLSRKLAGLSPRLNLILGPNESGKSRIFQAIRYGLFESYKGAAQHKQLLQSWTSLESPFVRIVFADDAIEFELQKQFLKGAYAQLSGGGNTLSGEDAEESLRKIIGSKQAGTRGAGIADLGIWPLLMVSQGESRKALQEDLNEDGRSRLQERLSKEIGVAAISAAGQRLMALAEQEYGRYFTASGQDSKVLRDARAELDGARAAFSLASEALRRQEQTAATLTDQRRELLNLEGRAQTAKQDAEAARGRADAARAARGRVEVAQGVVNTIAQRATGVEAALNTRIEADGAVERLTGNLADLESQLNQRASNQRGLEKALEQADQLVFDAEEGVRKARATAETAQRERRRVELNESHSDLSSRIATLERVERDVTEARSSRATMPLVDAACLTRLQSLDRNARTAAAQLQGAAVRVVVHLLQKATVDGGAHDAGESVQIDVVENRNISIGKLANVEIRPGGGDLNRLREAKVEADRDFSDALRELGLVNLDHAATIHAKLTELTQRVSELTNEAKATSSKSLAQLREDLGRLNAELERIGPVHQIEGDETALAAVLASAEEALTAARGIRDRANSALSEFRSGTAGVDAIADVTRRERDQLTNLYMSRPTADNLRIEHAEAVAARGRALTSLAAAQQAFAELGGAEVQSDAQRMAQAAEGLLSRVRDARSAVDQLQGALQGMIEAGNYETVQQVGARVEQAQNELSRIERQAAAAKRLWQVLAEERRRIVERLTAPVTLRVKPYLQDLFPGSTLDTGEGLDVMGLQSGNLKEPFAELSGGAQEQISLLTRIGIAEVLAGDGTLPLILDDALINTDPERIQRVHRALFRAANKLQVILFSCHDVLFDGLGAECVVTLEKGRGLSGVS